MAFDMAQPVSEEASHLNRVSSEHEDGSDLLNIHTIKVRPFIPLQ